MDNDTQELAKPINPIDKLLPMIAQAVAEWRQHNTAETIGATVKGRLDGAADDILMKLLGLSKGYGGDWVVDNTNSRAKTTAVGQYLQEQQSLAVNEWLKSIPMPEMTPALKAKLKKAAQAEYMQHLEWQVRSAAKAQAEKEAKALVEQLVVSNQINDYIRALKLINMEE